MDDSFDSAAEMMLYMDGSFESAALHATAPAFVESPEQKLKLYGLYAQAQKVDLTETFF